MYLRRKKTHQSLAFLTNESQKEKKKMTGHFRFRYHPEANEKRIVSGFFKGSFIRSYSRHIVQKKKKEDEDVVLGVTELFSFFFFALREKP